MSRVGGVPLNFLERAKLLTVRGIKTVPVQPREKACRLPSWQQRATTDLAHLEAWNLENSAYNTGAVAKLDGILIFDIDDLEIVERLRADGIDIAAMHTFRVQGSKPAPCGHFYFQHTAASRALANCDLARWSRATGKKSSTLFDVKANNSYVVGPGSIHPSGKVYEVVNDAPIIPIPDELTAWLATNKGVCWIDEGSHGPQREASLIETPSRPGTLAERIPEILARVTDEYDHNKLVLAEFGYDHRHQFDAALALHLFNVHEGDRSKVEQDFRKLRLHKDRTQQYDFTTIKDAEEKYKEAEASQWEISLRGVVIARSGDTAGDPSGSAGIIDTDKNPIELLDKSTTVQRRLAVGYFNKLFAYIESPGVECACRTD